MEYEESNEKEEGQMVQTETTGLHEMKIYNELRDNLWAHYDAFNQTMDETELIRHILQLRSILKRSDKIWNEINHSFSLKYAKLKMNAQTIYNGELNILANSLTQYITYLSYMGENKIPSALEKDQTYFTLKMKSKMEQIDYIKNAVNDIIEKGEAVWGNSASDSGLSLPVRAKEEQNMFFRPYKKITNSYKRW